MAEAEEKPGEPNGRVVVSGWRHLGVVFPMAASSVSILCRAERIADSSALREIQLRRARSTDGRR